MKYELAVANQWQMPCHFYPHGTWTKMHNNSLAVSLINQALENPWMHYLRDDKLALKNTANILKPLKMRSPKRKEVQVLSILPTPKLLRFLIRISYCDISMQLSSPFHFMRFFKSTTTFFSGS